MPTRTVPSSPAVADDENQSRSVAAVERAMDVLLYFGRTDQPDLGVTEIAGALGLTKAAVHRILTALRSRDLITLDTTTRRYALGHAAVALGRAYLARTDVRAMAAPELAWLSGRTHETATLSLRRGDTRLYADQVVPDQELRLEVSLGIPFPLHAGGSSKAFLAWVPDAELEAYLERHPLEALTDKTIVEPAKLRRDLAAIRKRGYATSLGERQAGAASVAAPVFDHDGHVVAVISVAGPALRFKPAAGAQVVTDLLDAAARISAQLGYQI
ncbi:IclR family transcriptional regulator [Amorphoplanes digitatis]|uniref:DNA-binding IclR family transcriptional regulator n=1 Tax=Actinoplanes digitatis TaxID=1868 RepID=A0A7W7HW14_9ACTN|nr:IclR family transcriptional regulator [Actinoplanes digitatis]MBB4761711.1 DNA-binding IclR family transcriptional regulator [Actinoplanes digitatis]GID90821.1 IclR family transcriptional regulator [Actinoplanes digitatis]